MDELVIPPTQSVRQRRKRFLETDACKAFTKSNSEPCNQIFAVRKPRLLTVMEWMRLKIKQNRRVSSKVVDW